MRRDEWVWVCVLLLAAGCAPRYATREAGVLSAAGISKIGSAGVLLGAKPPILFAESFDRLDPKRWREVEVRGQTDYSVVSLDGSMRLKAYSHGGASILLMPFRFDPDHYEWISWRWRVDQFLEGENLSTRGGSDASARVYVYFDTSGLPWQKRNIDYVWSATLPVGTILESAFSKASKIIVVESGQGAKGRWKTVSRNMEKDYKACFPGEPMPKVIAIGLMTDTDNTRSEALAYYDDLMISRRRPRPFFSVSP